ncbi:Na+/H+ antiporter NhaC family protein [Testudinibacter sp. TR-2022]|uniref:Na+/H+ antiporter NhaC family protein n=1 Tax=Testudinibacter sp. TR-2022 TaxID=2585029 RepID=UPI00111BCD10|nr:Na+/H+ antiporter NhaC family protein [Testudinibacter sp. TR-2022]TNH02170.1 Na+/H+ antiporter NhaC family protein [Pasteurellaceae bacterium Phil31]TNH06174.1 Na+/H+ antiporter NhaC family protein [Testudinibacter sp. TR-2022]TNH09311.1 Na+/H+ antiporter NhaC family protein [Testudinibacter sp. TR-2022]TNH10837.1 Na+/H+ antiporter NhaC family protein [Testudinibacter sp. TR-2022]TNH13159.1 Na+/H+ antiporter NhaC family protein [Testudinibacter sp. TR-2022]
MDFVDFSTSVWSIIPPLLALSLAIITRRVLLSLSAGIIVGALMLNGGNLLTAAQYTFSSVSSLVYSDGALNANYTNIIIFLILLGILTSLLTISGSNQAFVNWAQKHIKQKRGAKLLTVFLGVFIFIDDYFNSLAVGAIARPVTDKYKISRAKLAYLLDSTAAPMCVIMPISSWGAYIITLIGGLLATHAITEYSPIGAFIAMIGMNFYAIFALVLVFIVAIFSFDIGPMAHFERNAENAEAISDDISNGKQGRVMDLILPIFVLIIGTISMMIYTGAQSLAADRQVFSILGAFENTVVGTSLVVGGLAALITATLCALSSKQISLKEYVSAYALGIKSMFGAILVLFFAWTINTIVSDMHTGKYLSSLVSGSIAIGFLPVMLFILSAVMAFSTGTSWGTFGIMLPIAASIAVNADPALLLPCLSAVMAGAVCGDHCSPISDTTILSSTGASCNHIDHVTTQLPYAMLVAVSSAVGYLVVGFTQSGWLGFFATGIVMIGLILLFKKRTTKP